jgi:hypothetical protein
MGFPEGYQILHAPQPIRDASGHSRGHAKCTMNFDEVVGKIIEGGCLHSVAKFKVAHYHRVVPLDISISPHYNTARG